MVQQEKYAMFVDYFHLKSFQWEDESFLDTLITEYVRYEPYLRNAIMTFMNEQGHQGQRNRIYQIGLFNLDLIDKIRSLKTGQLGRLMSIDGTVTRTTEVKPELQIGTFKC